MPKKRGGSIPKISPKNNFLRKPGANRNRLVTETQFQVLVTQKQEPGYPGSNPRFWPKTEKLDLVDTLIGL
jgi:hypothetical protein